MRTVHAGQSPDPATGAVMQPIYATSTYAHQSPGVHKGYDYSRSQNPTRFAFERCLADLEDGQAGFAFASGLAAEATVLELLDHGSHVLVWTISTAARSVVRASPPPPANLDVSYIDPTDLAAFEAAIRPNTRMIWVESPSNPLLKLTDLEAVAELAKRRRLLSVIDNTFATPYCQRPLTLGFDVVVHSIDEISQRPFRHRRRRGRDGRQRRTDRTGAISAERDRRNRGTVRQLPRLARPENAGPAHGAALRECDGIAEWLEGRPDGSA